MRTLLIVSIVAVSTLALAAAESRTAPQPRKGKGGIAAPPIGRRIPPRFGRFEMRVQKAARFPKSERPKASVPTSDKGLQITIQPEKKKFAANGPVAFTVTLKNVSKKAFRLNQPGTLGGKPKLVMANQKTAAQWSITAKPRGFNPRDVAVIEPGKTLTYHVVVEGTMVFPPRPIPLPRPFPIPRRLPPRRLKGAPAVQGGGAAGKGVVLPAQPRIIIGKPGRPIRPPIFVGRSTLPVGQGPVKATLFFEFKAPKNAAEKKTPLWTGKLASKPVAFEIGKPSFIVPGTPVSKEQAIRVARPAAERALSAAYKPIKGVRPPKVGPWIESPEKTATAKKQKNGSWTVGWTRFPKTGHSYNVTVTVSRFGGASVREVFTGYSKAP